MFAPVRARLWELPDALHCSVVGTCLSTAALHALLSRLSLVRPADTEHQLHGRAVALASQQTTAGKLLHKLLDTTHASALRNFAHADTEPDLRRLWSDALEVGDIPGPYWAVLTHPACSYALRQEAFGRVHMLSHLVGAANRADLRRLAELETANAALRDKVERQQRRLQQMVAAAIPAPRQAGPDAAPGPSSAAQEDLARTLDDTRSRLNGSERHMEALEARLAEARAALDQARTIQDAADRTAQAIAGELMAAEAALAGDRAVDGMPDINGLSVLYVGGRRHATVAMQGLLARLGAGLVHHNGGLEEGAGRLPGLVSRADLIMFPVDCISHEAALALKRLCRNGGKPFLPLRSSGIGSFLAALRTAQFQQAAAA